MIERGFPLRADILVRSKPEAPTGNRQPSPVGQLLVLSNSSGFPSEKPLRSSRLCGLSSLVVRTGQGIFNRRGAMSAEKKGWSVRRGAGDKRPAGLWEFTAKIGLGRSLALDSWTGQTALTSLSRGNHNSVFEKAGYANARVVASSAGWYLISPDTIKPGDAGSFEPLPFVNSIAVPLHPRNQA